MKANVLDGHIFNIVQNHKIVEQSNLQQMLAGRGYNIPQATLSRRLKKLEIAKIDGVYKVMRFNQPHLPLILNLQVSEFGLIVLQTHPGQASSLAYFFDQKYVNYSQKTTHDNWILGTIAGDDTVLLIIKNRSCLDSVLNMLYVEFSYLKPLYTSS
ncbi:arginine repressor [Candidatus Bandiella euplotis]|uniref:Arginine repressor n=1 Tax=Candidatus Bandiella euplotis TaxID=1664265 RepID=A0ABZ0UK89_9RICK|nr:ArgR family transcriptional regulator [Candidatus Bandiella woodruffii]WPX96533.1 ArgR family transcriptional regulator [Candidatus Bandiella woodruffii]